MKKILAKIHLWLSIPFGIIISLLCLSGAILVFESELLELFRHDTYYVQEVKETPLPMEILIPAVQKQLPDSVKISGVTIPSDRRKNYRMSPEGQGRTSFLVDPYSGEIRGKVAPYAKGEFFTTVRQLHRWFLFPYKRGEFSWGKTITGVSTLVFLFILITGLIIWIPKTMKMFKRKASVKWNKGTFRRWYDVHLAGGFYTGLFLLLFCITGLTWSFDWYRNGFYKLFGAEITQNRQQNQSPADTSSTDTPEKRNSQSEDRPAEKEEKTENTGREANNPENHTEREEKRERRGNRENRGGKGEGEQRRNRGNRDSGNENQESGRRKRSGRNPNSERNSETYTNYAIWEKVARQLKKENPNSRSISIQQGTATVAINNYGNMRASDKYSFHPRTGEITDSQLYKDAEQATKIRGWIYSLHVGSWGGITTRILSFIACLIGTALPITGYYIFYKKRKKKK
ncbi:MAG: PepSY domain-containing protein [Candidatus Azobacteroides sp.]|nr:PepSY domain-containing protein [Candidatus Azobacteroides sp.]